MVYIMFDTARLARYVHANSSDKRCLNMTKIRQRASLATLRQSYRTARNRAQLLDLELEGNKQILLLKEIELQQVRAIKDVFEELSITDPLMGILNPRGLEHALHRMVDEAVRHPNHDECLVVVECDLDSFKYINDTFGHEAGNKALKNLAREMRERIHPRLTDALGRPGGDEVRFIGVGDPEEIKKNFKKFQTYLENRKVAPVDICGDGTCHLVQDWERYGVSFGIAILNKAFILEHYGISSFDDLNGQINKRQLATERICGDLIKHADRELYDNKNRISRVYLIGEGKTKRGHVASPTNPHTPKP